MTQKIGGISQVVEALGRWSPNDLAYIEKFTLAGCPSSLELVAWFQRRGSPWPDLAQPMSRVVLHFDGVVALRIDHFGGGRTQIMGFQILDVSDRHHEGIRFEVGDYEDGRIQFSAESITVLSAEPLRVVAC